MTPPTRINAVLDACVLYPAPIRDLLLSLYSITALTPDSFIASLIKPNKFLALAAFENLVKRLKNPPLNNLQVLETFHKLGLRNTRLLLLEINK